MIDRRNDICGHNILKHGPSVGLTRRMSPQSNTMNESQCPTILEAVQNHSSDTLVVDDVSRKEEVEVLKQISKI